MLNEALPHFIPYSFVTLVGSPWYPSPRRTAGGSSRWRRGFATRRCEPRLVRGLELHRSRPRYALASGEAAEEDFARAVQRASASLESAWLGPMPEPKSRARNSRLAAAHDPSWSRNSQNRLIAVLLFCCHPSKWDPLQWRTSSLHQPSWQGPLIPRSLVAAGRSNGKGRRRVS